MKKIASFFFVSSILLIGMAAVSCNDPQETPEAPKEDLSAEIVITGALTPKGCAKLGQEVTFSLDDVKGEPTSYTWTFPGGNPETSTEASPKVVWSEQTNFANVSVVLTRESDNATTTVTKTISAGKCPLLRILPDYEYDSYSFEMKNYGGWIGYTGAGQNVGMDVDNQLLSVVEGGANGTAHCCKVNAPIINSEGDKYGGYVQIFPRNNWMCNAQLEKDKNYELEFWCKRQAPNDNFAFGVVRVVNQSTMWDNALGLTSSVDWSAFYPGEWKEEGLDVFYESYALTQQKTQDWVKTNVSFTATKDCNNAYPMFEAHGWMNTDVVFFDEVQIYLIEE